MKEDEGSSSESAIELIDNVATWKEYLRENFPWLEVNGSSRNQFQAEIQSFRVGESALAVIRSASTVVNRTSYLASRSDAGYVKVLWQLAGAMEIEQDKRRSIVVPGQACVCDTARPYRVSLADGSYFAVLTLPYEAIPGWERISQKLCGSVLSDIVSARAALGAFMELLRSSYSADSECAENVLCGIRWMLSAALRMSAKQTASADRNAVRINKAQSFILKNIDNPDLNPDQIANLLHMSRRALYLLFKGYETTPAKMINDLRLELCRKALADPGQRMRSVTEIAFDNGFIDCATFSKVFKSQYGMTPTDWRNQSLFQVPDAAQSRD